MYSCVMSTMMIFQATSDIFPSYALRLFYLITHASKMAPVYFGCVLETSDNWWVFLAAKANTHSLHWSTSCKCKRAAECVKWGSSCGAGFHLFNNLITNSQQLSALRHYGTLILTPSVWAVFSKCCILDYTRN